MKPNDDILSRIKPQPEMEPPELDFARLRERAEARKLRRELFWVAIGGWLSAIAMLLGFILLCRAAPVIPGGEWLALTAGVSFVLSCAVGAASLILYAKRKERRL